MRTDREFIDGIYEKAKNYDKYDTLDNITFLDKSYHSRKAKLQLVASLTLVMLTGIGYSNANFVTIDKMLIPNSYENLELSSTESLVRTMEPMMAYMSEPLHFNPIEEADVICTAIVTEIFKSNYEKDLNNITTPVLFETLETVKGAINPEFELLVAGGFDDFSKVYLDYEAVFELGEEVLLFLQSSPDDMSLYILSGASRGKYSTDNSYLYVNSDGISYTVNQLKNHFDS